MHNVLPHQNMLDNNGNLKRILEWEDSVCEERERERESNDSVLELSTKHDPNEFNFIIYGIWKDNESFPLQFYDDYTSWVFQLIKSACYEFSVDYYEIIARHWLLRKNDKTPMSLQYLI